ncbi:MAG: PqqD family protein [Candidatus Thermoplasmatota archaeon]
MLKKNKKGRIPREEFLEFKPQRLDFEWSKNDEGLVEIKVPKFESDIGKSFCKLIKKDTEFKAKLDEIGSIVWEHCDGDTTVKEILGILEKQFSDEEDIDQRLFYFLYQMKKLDYIEYQKNN